MQTWLQACKGKFWAISAVLFGPWNALLVLSVMTRLSKGTAFASYLVANGDRMKAILVLLFSLYFVLALMMWAVGRRKPEQRTRGNRGGAEAEAVIGLSLKQIIGWGLLAMATVPALAGISVIMQQADVVDTLNRFVGQQSAINSGFIWLLSISVIIMIPTMVIWLVWMWRAWSSVKQTEDETASWGYEYD